MGADLENPAVSATKAAARPTAGSRPQPETEQPRVPPRETHDRAATEWARLNYGVTIAKRLVTEANPELKKLIDDKRVQSVLCTDLKRACTRLNIAHEGGPLMVVDAVSEDGKRSVQERGVMIEANQIKSLPDAVFLVTWGLTEAQRRETGRKDKDPRKDEQGCLEEVGVNLRRIVQKIERELGGSAIKPEQRADAEQFKAVLEKWSKNPASFLNR